MVRYRWYHLLTSKDFLYIANKVSSFAFDSSNKKGFEVTYTSKNNISGIFYHVSLLSQNNTNIDILNAIQFSISNINDSIYLRLQDPTRSIKEFSNTLFELCDLDLAFEQISISFKNVEEWISFRKHNALLNIVKISNLKITDNISSEVTFKSNSYNIDLDLNKVDILKDKTYTITSMSWLVNTSGNFHKILVSKSGLIYISEYLILDFLDYIESHIF